MKSGRQSNRGACGGIVASHDRWSVELFVDLPVSIENTALQVVPDYCLRGGISLWSEVCHSAAHVSDSALPDSDGDKILPEINA